MVVFGDALEMLKEQMRVSRESWPRGMWIAYEDTDLWPDSSLQPFIYACVDGGHVPWVASQTDLLADDWYVVD